MNCRWFSTSSRGLGGMDLQDNAPGKRPSAGSRWTGTRLKDTEPPLCSKNRSKDQDKPQDQRQMTTTSAEETVQAPFKESEWAVNALLHLVQHPSVHHVIASRLGWWKTSWEACQSLLTLMDDPRVILEPLEERSIQVTSSEVCLTWQRFHPQLLSW